MKKLMEKILIVDDLESNRDMLRQLLTYKGYDVLEATNGQEAIESFKQEKPDLILMDINMPIMNGHQSTQKIKAISNEEYIPIIFITALSSDESLTKTLDSGGDDFVGKPFNFDVIQSKISAHLRIRQLTQQLNDKNQQLSEHNLYLSNEHELINYFFDNALKQSFLDKRYINYHTSPLSAFNGDILLSERGPKGGLYLVTGDFTGHGLAASLGTLPVSQVFFKMARSGASVNDIAREINTQLKNVLPVGMFFAANILQLDPSCSFISIWSGGLMDGYHFDQEGNKKNSIRSGHLPLGILPDDIFKSDPELISVEKNDQLYFYSDGITEAQNSEGKMFGEERLKHALHTCRENRIEQLIKTLQDFCGECEQTDDITLVELTCDEIPQEEKEDKLNNNIIPYRCSIVLTEQMMRESDPITILVALSTSQPLLNKHRSMIHTLFCELYNNALDYSLLGLNSSMKSNCENFTKFYDLKQLALDKLQAARIQVDLIVEIRNSNPYLKIIMEDNGQGFEQAIETSSKSELYGKGIKIIKDLSDSLVYSENGRKVEVLYNLS